MAPQANGCRKADVAQKKSPDKTLWHREREHQGRFKLHICTKSMTELRNQLEKLTNLRKKCARGSTYWWTKSNDRLGRMLHRYYYNSPDDSNWRIIIATYNSVQTRCTRLQLLEAHHPLMRIEGQQATTTRGNLRQDQQWRRMRTSTTTPTRAARADRKSNY